MLDSYTFRALDMEVDFDDYKKAHNSIFKITAISREWIHWWFYWVHKGNARVYGVYLGDTLVGIWGVEPRVLFNKDKNINVGRCFATGILEDHRRQGLFVALSKFALSEEKKLGQYDYIVGFPQSGRSVVGGHLKAGWYIVQNIDVYKYIPSQDDRLNPSTHLNTFDTGDKFLLEVEEIDDYPFCPDGSFVKWHKTRWTKHPDIHYINRATTGGFIVIKQYKDWAHLLALECTVPRGYTWLLRCAKLLCNTHGWSWISMWCADNQLHRDIIIEEGFTKTADTIHLIAYNINATENLHLDSCNIQMGIEEGY